VTPPPGRDPGALLRIAQISDLHIDGSLRANQRVARVMDYLRAMPQPPDALLVTGDIVEHGTEAEYEEAARLLAAPFPVLTCPGNHDERRTYRKILLRESSDGDGDSNTDDEPAPINRLHRIGTAALLLCDSTIPGAGDGHLAEATLAWIDQTLADLPTGTPSLLVFHHPPADLHNAYIDPAKLRNPASLAALLAVHPDVVAVIAGHSHTAAATTFAGRPLLVGLAAAYTLRLPGESANPRDDAAPVGVAIHVLDADRRLTTHFRGVS
jgi:Icc protein